MQTLPGPSRDAGESGGTPAAARHSGGRRRLVAMLGDRLRIRLRTAGPRMQRFVRLVVDIGRLGAQQLRRDAAHQMAAALAFRTLFALLPIFVLGTILVRALGGFAQFREMFAELLAGIGMHEIVIQPLGAAGTADPGQVSSQSLSDFVLGLLGEVEKLNLAAITWVGVAVLTYSAISLMSTIEASFNRILHVNEGRPWLRRMTIYWTTITVAPGILVLARYVDAQFDQFVAAQVSLKWAVNGMSAAWSFVVTWLVVFAIYRLVPSTHVRTRPALGGAFVTALLLEVGKQTLSLYLERALSVRQLYGSLGLVPLFMFWVYLMWLVVLLGLEVTALLQTIESNPRRALGRDFSRRPGLTDPAAAVAVTECVAARFARGLSTEASDIAEVIGLPETTAVVILDRLVDAGILRPVAMPEGAVVLARPAERIDAADVLDIGFGLTADGGDVEGASPLLARLRAAQRDVLSGTRILSGTAPDGTAG